MSDGPFSPILRPTRLSVMAIFVLIIVTLPFMALVQWVKGVFGLDG